MQHHVDEIARAVHAARAAGFSVYRIRRSVEGGALGAALDAELQAVNDAARRAAGEYIDAPAVVEAALSGRLNPPAAVDAAAELETNAENALFKILDTVQEGQVSGLSLRQIERAAAGEYTTPAGAAITRAVQGAMEFHEIEVVTGQFNAALEIAREVQADVEAGRRGPGGEPVSPLERERAVDAAALTNRRPPALPVKRPPRAIDEAFAGLD